MRRKQMRNKILGSFYRRGSNGSVYLYFREKGTLVETDIADTWRAEKDSYVVQWEGMPHYDSGYAFHGFDTFGEAYQEFERQREES
jgi:hypothetical protein